MTKFAFLVHPRDLSDVYRKYPISRYLPKSIMYALLRFLPPIRVGKIRVGKGVVGDVISITLTSSQIMQNKSVSYRKILAALRFAKKRGAQIVGLGALTSSITNGGEDLVGKVDIAITNGNTLTTAVTFEAVQKLAKLYAKDLSKANIAIIGATGSIGRALSLLFMEAGAQNLLLVGRTPVNLEDLQKDIYANYNKDIPVTTNLESIKQSDFVIVTTNAPSAFITSEHLKNGSIVYDITQPRNVSREVKDSKKDIIVIDGGIVEVPNMQSSPIFNLNTNYCFACVAETILLTLEGRFENFSIGRVNKDDVKELWQIARKHHFAIAPFTSFGELVQ